MIAFNALAEGTDLWRSSARLSTMGPVDVTRRKSRRVAGALQVSCDSTSNHFQVESGDSSALAADDTIFVQGLEFDVKAIDTSNNLIELYDAGRRQMLFAPLIRPRLCSDRVQVVLRRVGRDLHQPDRRPRLASEHEQQLGWHQRRAQG